MIDELQPDVKREEGGESSETTSPDSSNEHVYEPVRISELFY